MRALSHVLSYIFHPIMVPLYAVIYLMATNPFRYHSLSTNVGGYVAIYLLMYTVVFPGVAMIFMRRLGLIKSMQLHERGERLLPLMIMTFFFFSAYLALNKSEFHPDIAKVLLAASVTIVIAYIITAFSKKISLHTIGMGALVAVVMYSSTFAVYSVYGLLFLIVLIAGLVGTARLYLNAHTPREVYQGYFLGYFVQMLILVLF